MVSDRAWPPRVAGQFSSVAVKRAGPSSLLSKMTAAAPARLRLTRAMRLRQRGDFARLKQQGHRLVRGCLVLNWLELPAGAQTRFAVITTRKLGNAVVRNRCRRLLRECFRLHRLALLRPVEMVLIARQSMVGQNFSVVEQTYLGALREAKLIG